MRNIFDYLKSITATKIDLSDEIDFESVYNIFMINRFLSMHPETTFFAHFMNKGNISKKDHYKFLLFSLEQKNIFFKYQKKDKNPDLKIIRELFDVGEETAKDYSKMLTKKNIKYIKKKYGGKGRKSSVK